MVKKYNKYIIGKKVGMTQIFDEDGEVKAVTVVKVDRCLLFDIKQSIESDNYQLVNVGYGSKKSKHVNSPKGGYFKKCNIDPVIFYKSIKLTSDVIGEARDVMQITPDIFEESEIVSVRSKSKGNGFTGTIKKGFSRGLMTHGSKSKRLPGSIGGGTTPGHVLKGTTMGGRTGDSFVTVKNLVIVKIQGDCVLISGAVPGKNGYVEIYN